MNTELVDNTKSAGTWNINSAYWVQIIREDHDRYRRELTDAAVMRSIGSCDGLTVLDAGCGEGYMARKLASLGATVTGIDSSSKLIDAARSYTGEHDSAISFDVGNVDSLPYADQIFDLILCNHLINDLRNPTSALREFGRVTRQGGRIIILMLHPCFYNKHTERLSNGNGLLSTDYFELRSIEQHFVVDGLTSPAANTAWFRPLEFYTEELRTSGFAIESLTEPHPTPEQLSDDPWWREGFTRPLFMLISAERR